MLLLYSMNCSVKNVSVVPDIGRYVKFVIRDLFCLDFLRLSVKRTSSCTEQDT